METIPFILAGATGYLLGSIPMGVLLAKVFGWENPRTYGSGHTGANNVARRAGRAAFVLVLAADLSKGLAAVLAVPLISANPWAVPVAGTAAVVGHCWPIWLRFSGGMGLATTAGVILSRSWPTLILAVAVLAILKFVVIRHSPRATIIAAALTPFIALGVGILYTDPTFWVVSSVVLIILVRYSGEWNRQYGPGHQTDW